MLSPRFRSHVFELWSRFWASGLTNPITAIEQITYLLFLKQLEALDEERTRRFGAKSIFALREVCGLPHHPELDQFHVNFLDCKGHEASRWKNIKNAPAVTAGGVTLHEHLSKYVFPWLRELDLILEETAVRQDENGIGARMHAPMENAAFQLPPDKVETLRFAIDTVDALFQSVGRRGANYDLMGDTFEYLLDEIRTSGKNGQFRTPRHLIRFMIELLNVEKGCRIVDPAAGTCGFLINSLLHLRKKHTDPKKLRLEWDGTPHRADGSDLDAELYLKGEYFTAFENDQTMARIGWMNMVLHGIERPTVEWRDSLSGRIGAEHSNAYDYALANPPYTGNVDKSDLSMLPGRFPRTVKGALTDKSELLFVWLILDLLKVGGRGAVIVPEGVLFGSTTAHRRLRQQLLFDNLLEAVISLPAGVFQPYTGVKTSILVFQKVNQERRKADAPHTAEVWFYEVAGDGYSLDAKRSDRPEENDLWDALAKFKTRTVETRDYFKPDFFDERWRDLDERTLNTFDKLARKYEKDSVWSLHELFSLPQNPQQATEQITKAQAAHITALYEACLDIAKPSATAAAANAKKSPEQKRDAAIKKLKVYVTGLDGLFREAGQDLLEDDDEKRGFKNYATKALKLVRDEIRRDALERLPILAESLAGDAASATPLLKEISPEDARVEWRPEVEAIVREFAKLDGYDITLRSPDVKLLKDALPESRSWSAPVRVWQRNDEWQSEDGVLTGSHDAQGNLRHEFLLDETLYWPDGTAKPEFLEPGCIEANDLNLAAGRYKPFTLATRSDAKPADIIRELQVLEARIQQGLERLLAMME